MANSKVNIDRLTDAELTQRYVNRFKELQDLRAQYEKMVKNYRSEKKEGAGKIALSPSLSLLKTARGLVREAEFEIPDCKEVLEGLASGIALGSLSP